MKLALVFVAILLLMPVAAFAVIQGPINPGKSGWDAKKYLSDKAANGTLAINKTSILVIQIDKPVYNMTDIVHLRGVVSNPHDGLAVAIKVISPLNSLQEIRQITPFSDGSFRTTITLSGPQWHEPGKYLIVVNYGTAKANTSFNYTAIPSVPEFGSIAAIILVSALTFGVLFTRKFQLQNKS